MKVVSCFLASLVAIHTGVHAVDYYNSDIAAREAHPEQQQRGRTERTGPQANYRDRGNSYGEANRANYARGYEHGEQNGQNQGNTVVVPQQTSPYPPPAPYPYSPDNAGS